MFIREYTDLTEMARVGFVPVGTTDTVEVYVHTNDGGNTPHFHVRKYGRNGDFEWKTCVKYESAEYFFHGKYKDKLPNKRIAKDLDKMLRTVDKADRHKRTYWEIAIDEWNRNNSSMILDLNIIQPDYTTL